MMPRTLNPWYSLCGTVSSNVTPINGMVYSFFFVFKFFFFFNFYLPLFFTVVALDLKNEPWAATWGTGISLYSYSTFVSVITANFHSTLACLFAFRFLLFAFRFGFVHFIFLGNTSTDWNLAVQRIGNHIHQQSGGGKFLIFAEGRTKTKK